MWSKVEVQSQTNWNIKSFGHERMTICRSSSSVPLKGLGPACRRKSGCRLQLKTVQKPVISGNCAVFYFQPDQSHRPYTSWTWYYAGRTIAQISRSVAEGQWVSDSHQRNYHYIYQGNPEYIFYLYMLEDFYNLKFKKSHTFSSM